MSASKSLKRKAQSSQAPHKVQMKRAKEPSPDFEDIENGDGDSDIGGDMGIYADPMIDPPGSSSSDSGEDPSDDEVDEEEEDEFGSSSEAGPSQPRSHLYAPPTLDELDRLQTSSSSNTFNLQMEALLSKTLLSSTPHPGLKAVLAALHDAILNLPSLSPLPPKEASKRAGGVSWVGGDAFHPEKGSSKWTLGWEKPQEVFVGGSLPVVGGYRKGKGEEGEVDMVVVMPPDMFSPKDRMSYRYFQKRVHYLAIIYAALQKLVKSKDSVLKGTKVGWSLAGGDARRPVISVTAAKDQGLKHALTILLHASIPPSVFPPSSLGPTKSLVRISQDEEDHTPTPLYSSSILHDTLYKNDLLSLHHLSTLMGDRVVGSYLALWRIWASRRGISPNRGGSGWFAGVLLRWIVEGGDISTGTPERGVTKRYRGLGKGVGYWGGLKAVWEFLAQTDFEKTPVFLASDEPALLKSDFTRAFSDILVDSTGSVNLFAEWEKADLQLLQYHARETLALLEDTASDHFGDVFLRDVKLQPAVFDESIRVDVSNAAFSGTLHEQSERPSRLDLLSHELSSVLRRGLSDRAKIVSVRPRLPDSLDIGLIFDPSQATRLLDIGPSSDSTAAGTEFRKLWGTKAELRRFKDGSISESILWEITRPEDATAIPSRIVSWLLNLHFNIPEEDITSWSANPTWSSITQIPASARKAIHVEGSEKLGFRPVMESYDELYKLLKSIDSDLPLSILNVSPADEALRYGSTFIPHPVEYSRWARAPDSLKWIPTAEIILQFESSPKWPDDLAAIQKVKLALLEKIARIVQARVPDAQTSVVLDPNASEIQDHAGLEVLMPRGVGFKIRIFHDRERVLLERIVHEDAPVFSTSLPRPPRRLAIPALALWQKRFLHSPQHHSGIAPLHHRFPSFSAACRLLKRWFSTHMLGLLVPSPAVELLMVSVYLDPGALGAPHSPTTAFLRAMRLLASWEWREGPLFVPLWTSNRAEEHSARTRFPQEKREEAIGRWEQKWKSSETHSWAIVTEEDLDGHRWTGGIGRVVAGRVQALARATLTAVETQTLTGHLNVVSLFKIPTRDYDVLLHLSPALSTRSAQALEPDEGAWSSTGYANLSVRGVYGEGIKAHFDPCGSLARDIQRLYPDTLLVFFDTHGGNVIGLLWNPIKATPRALKPFLGYNTKPAQGEAALVQINQDSILAEVARMGKGLIERIERR